MSCFIVLINKFKGDAPFKAGYANMAQAAIKAAGGKYRLFGEDAVLLEGPEKFENGEGIVIEFPDTETARKLWFGPYAEAKKLREGASDTIAIAITSDWFEGDEGFQVLGNIAARKARS